MKKRVKNFMEGILWRLQFKKIPKENDGRCISCHAGNPKVECNGIDRKCPCNHDQQLKRIITFHFLDINKQP